MERRARTSSPPDPDTRLEESLWHLGLAGGGGGGRGPPSPRYPERPGEPDCNYYLRTGTCGYRERCRFNHPRNRGAVAGEVRDGSPEFPERAGQPPCQFFLRTGTCRYGAACKYDHPRQAGLAPPAAMLSYLGYPLRPGEKECSYYMRMGHCKFGSTCKFNHPLPATASMSPYPGVQPPLVPAGAQYSTIDVASPSLLPASYVHMPYAPMLVSPGVVPVPGWTTYPQRVSPAVSPGAQQSTPYESSNRLSPSAPAYEATYPFTLSAAGIPDDAHKEYMFPERPGQPPCQYYMRTGDCKFGSTCKYHHPPERMAPETNCFLSPVGLPLRPGAPLCLFYAQHAVCKFGPTCKFDHPMGKINHSTATSSVTDMSVGFYPVGVSVGTLAQSSSSSELRPEFISNNDAFSIRMPSSGGMPSSSTGAMFSRGSYLPHRVNHGGKISTSS